jgi:hypothetical protein
MRTLHAIVTLPWCRWLETGRQRGGARPGSQAPDWAASARETMKSEWGRGLHQARHNGVNDRGNNAAVAWAQLQPMECADGRAPRLITERYTAHRLQAITDLAQRWAFHLDRIQRGLTGIPQPLVGSVF